MILILRVLFDFLLFIHCPSLAESKEPEKSEDKAADVEEMEAETEQDEEYEVVDDTEANNNKGEWASIRITS